MIFQLAEDFAAILDAMPAEHPRRRILSLLDEAICRDIHFIDRHPTTLFQCLWNTCWWYDCPEAAEHYAATDGPWNHEGMKLHRLLEQWHGEKVQVQPCFPWLRSLRPPAMLVGTAQRLVLTGHKDYVTCLCFSADGQRIASGSDDNTIRVWESQIGAEVAVFCAPPNRARPKIKCLCFSPDGQWIISGSTDHSLYVWDSRGKETALAARRFGATVNSVSCSSDTARIACGMGAGDHTVRIVDANSLHDLAIFKGHAAAVTSVSFSPDGHLVASAAEDKTVLIWDVQSAKSLAVCSGHEERVRSVCFSPDGRFVASASEDKTVRLWDLQECTKPRVLYGHEGAVRSVGVSPDGQLLASASQDKTVRLWDIRTCQELRVFRGHEYDVTSICFSPDGRFLASASEDKTVRLWDIARRADVTCWQGYEDRLAHGFFSRDRQFVATGLWQGVVHVWDAQTGAEMAVLETHDCVQTICFSEDSRLLAVGLMNGMVRVWNVQDGANILVLLEASKDKRRMTTAVCISPNATQIATGSHDGTTQLWDARTGAEVWGVERSFFSNSPGHKDRVNALAFSPDGGRIASASSDDTVRIWDVRTGAEIWVVRAHTSWVWEVEFSRDGQRFVTSSRDGTMRVWNATNFQCIEVIHGTGDLAAVAAGPKIFPFRMLARGLETVLKTAASRQEIAWLPMELKRIATLPSGRVWAGALPNYRALVQLEGGEIAD